MASIDTILVPLYAAASNVFVGPLLLIATALMLYPFAHLILIAGCLVGIALCVALHLQRVATPVTVVNWWQETVLVTGGSHGVGRSLVGMLLKLKPKRIVVLDVNEYDHGSELVSFFKCDVTSNTAVKEVAAKITEKVRFPLHCGNTDEQFGDVTMIVNNAGIVNGAEFKDLTEGQIQKCIEVNLLGPIWITKAFLPGMLQKRHGHVLNVCSVLGLTGARSMTDYCASKFGLVGFTEALRQEVVGTNVKVTGVFPGLIKTGMFDGVVYKYPFLTPELETDKVASAIVKALQANRSAEIKLPFFVELTPALRLLPVEFIDFVKEFTGSNNSMHTFKGSKKH
ncbi:hypothetical protein HK101_001244 [Irineochytrium annulatum]|nr:hypothetical protein HK101_001244 [Irineochytrium annulatum]